MEPAEYVECEEEKLVVIAAKVSTITERERESGEESRVRFVQK